MHGSPLARDLAIPRLLMPPTPGILCALGMLVADLRHDLVQTRLAGTALSSAEAAAIFAPMLAEARRLLDGDRVPPGRQRIETRLDMRYVGQSFELPIPLAGFGEAEWAALVPAFHAEHASRFGHNDPASPVEIVSFGVTATGLIDTPELPRPSQGGAEPPDDARRGTPPGLFRGREGPAGRQWIDCPVWQREALLAGNRIRRAGDRRRGLGNDRALSGRPGPGRRDRQPDCRGRRINPGEESHERGGADPVLVLDRQHLYLTVW